jgi:hypothetical protein
VRVRPGLIQGEAGICDNDPHPFQDRYIRVRDSLRFLFVVDSTNIHTNPFYKSMCAITAVPGKGGFCGGREISAMHCKPYAQRVLIQSHRFTSKPLPKMDPLSKLRMPTERRDDLVDRS